MKKKCYPIGDIEKVARKQRELTKKRQWVASVGDMSAKERESQPALPSTVPPEADREAENLKNKPCGLQPNDSVEDAIKRADDLSGDGWHRGEMTNNQDLRRIVLLAYEVRILRQNNKVLAGPPSNAPAEADRRKRAGLN